MSDKDRILCTVISKFEKILFTLCVFTPEDDDMFKILEKLLNEVFTFISILLLFSLKKSVSEIQPSRPFMHT